MIIKYHNLVSLARQSEKARKYVAPDPECRTRLKESCFTGVFTEICTLD